jgi:hypothetical protein
LRGRDLGGVKAQSVAVEDWAGKGVRVAARRVLLERPSEILRGRVRRGGHLEE